MAQRNHVLYGILVFAVVVITLMALPFLFQPTAAAKAPYDAIPPRTPKPDDASPEGALIWLEGEFGAFWPWDEHPWYDVWTVVQWRDPQYKWHDVEGWRGTLDSVKIDDYGIVLGEKRWWVAINDLGKGPFRWLVYKNEGGSLLATSGTFYLPRRPDRLVKIEVFLEP